MRMGSTQTKDHIWNQNKGCWGGHCYPSNHSNDTTMIGETELN